LALSTFPSFFVPSLLHSSSRNFFQFVHMRGQQWWLWRESCSNSFSNGSTLCICIASSYYECSCEVLRDRLRKNTPTSRQPWTNHPSMMFASVEWGDQILPFLFLHTWMPIILLALLSP
jgi:hypothetical protein